VLLILRILTWLIVTYRRWLSGRGPLRNVVCSFAREESCSAYGLRTAQQASSAPQAMGRILRRLRRCREACVVRDGTTITWATIHDLPPHVLVAEMQQDHELDAAIARMLVTRRAVAKVRGDAAAAAACAAAPRGHPRIVVRATAVRRWRRRFVTLAFLALLPLVGVRGLWR
jgi:putative component of membrane protein insertase Oxa1/YidC/SpoIIIJ protein YidD